jgi:tetratricopeptide (TPR) repeat protein
MVSAGHLGADSPLSSRRSERPRGFWGRLAGWARRPLAPLSWLLQGRTRREHREALRQLSSPEIEHADDRTLLRIGDACLQAHDRERACAAYWSAGRMLIHRQQYQKAAAMLKRVVAIAPMEPRARLELAQSFELLKRRREAAQQYHAAGVLLRDTAPAEAMELLAYALSLDPSDGSISVQLVAMRAALGISAPPRPVPTPAPAVAPAPPPVPPARPPDDDAIMILEPEEFMAYLLDDNATIKYSAQDLDRLLREGASSG